MISPKKKTIVRNVSLLESVDVTHVSLVDRPANRLAFHVVKRSNKTTPTDIQLDGAIKPASINKVAATKEPKGKWVRDKRGNRYFVPEDRKPRINDKTGAKGMVRNHRRSGTKMPRVKA